MRTKERLDDATCHMPHLIICWVYVELRSKKSFVGEILGVIELVELTRQGCAEKSGVEETWLHSKKVGSTKRGCAPKKVGI